jgi:metal-responsive CopG/Arc/MetJ family transcriptional regulator
MNSKDTATRQREWRARRKAEGYRMTTVWLDPDVVELLDGLVESSDKSSQAARAELINEAIRQYSITGKS